MCSVDGFAWWWCTQKHLNKNLFSNSCADACKKVYSSPIAAKRSDRVTSHRAATDRFIYNPAPAVRTRKSRRQQAQPRSVTRGEAVAPRNESCQTSGANRWAQQLTGTALIPISKAPASGAAGARLLGEMPATASQEAENQSLARRALVFKHTKERDMKVFVWADVGQCSYRYHSGGGVVVFAETEQRAREIANATPGCAIQESETPEEVRDVAGGGERVFIMPDAGCC